MTRGPVVHLAGGDAALRSALEAAVVRGGGRPGPLEEARALVAATGPEELRGLLEAAPDLEWVQLAGAGIDAFREVLDDRRVWTSAKGAYALPVAEHALALVLAALRRLGERARATTWGEQAGETLHGRRVLVVGGGGIGTELARLLGVFGTETVVVRRRPDPVPGADRTVAFDALDAELADAEVVVLAAALTPETERMLDARRLGLMRADAVLVNVARGALVDTPALLGALAAGRLSAFATDVTDPEPLPDGHPLWSHPRVLVTPHTADTPPMIRRLLGERVEENVRRFAAGAALTGLVDPRAGY